MRIAAVDAGTNSFHLLVVDAHRDGTFVPLLREKDMLRLGDATSRHLGDLPCVADRLAPPDPLEQVDARRSEENQRRDPAQGVLGDDATDPLVVPAACLLLGGTHQSLYTRQSRGWIGNGHSRRLPPARYVGNGTLVLRPMSSCDPDPTDGTVSHINDRVMRVDPTRKGDNS